MIKKLLFISLLILAASPFFAVGVAHAQTTGGCSEGKCTYVPLEPLPGVNQTGLGFADYISGMFRLFITLGALFAVLMMVLAGIGYMTSSSPLDLSKAKDRMWAALYGLLLLVACWLILYTINPNLLRFDLFTTTLNTTAQKNTAPGIQPNSGGGGASGESQKNVFQTPTAQVNAEIAKCESEGKRYVPKTLDGMSYSACE